MQYLLRSVGSASGSDPCVSPPPPPPHAIYTTVRTIASYFQHGKGGDVQTQNPLILSTISWSGCVWCYSSAEYKYEGPKMPTDDFVVNEDDLVLGKWIQ